MLNFARVALALFAAVFLASCSTPSSTPPLSSGPIAGSTAARPNRFADYVKIISTTNQGTR